MPLKNFSIRGRSTSKGLISEEEILNKIDDGTFKDWHSTVPVFHQHIHEQLLELQRAGKITGYSPTQYEGKDIYTIGGILSFTGVSPDISSQSHLE